jgi:hypothetical protein
MKSTLSTYPESIPAYPGKSVDLIVDVSTGNEHPLWLEAEVRLESGLSLQQHRSVREGRFRLGICDGRDSISRPITLYAEHNVKPHLYKCHVTVLAYDRKGKIAGRSDGHTLVKCGTK